MELHKRLADLVGHEVFLTFPEVQEDTDVPWGVLAEVGDDYLVIRAKDEGGQENSTTDWLVRLGAVRAVTHPSDCPTCATDAAASIGRKVGS